MVLISRKKTNHCLLVTAEENKQNSNHKNHAGIKCLANLNKPQLVLLLLIRLNSEIKRLKHTNQDIMNICIILGTLEKSMG